MVSSQVSYDRKREWPCRETAVGKDACQHRPQLLQRLAHPGTMDVDIVNCMPNIMRALIQQLALSPDMLETFRPELERLDEICDHRD